MSITKIESIEVTTGYDIIERERKRLIRLKKRDNDWWDNPHRSDWAKAQFGPTLTEHDGTTHMNGDKVDDYGCNICGELPDLKEKILVLDFSFCDEYGCGMTVCSKCVEEMKAKLK